MKNKHLKKLYKKYLSGSCTEDERRQVEEQGLNFLLTDIPWENDKHGDKSETRDAIFSQLQNSIETRESRRTIRRRVWYAAASFILIVSTALLFYRSSGNGQNYTRLQTVPAAESDIAPGTNTAILTLSDGSVINLRAVKNGVIASQNSTEIQKLNNGELRYRSGETLPGAPIAYNTVSTPRGGQYQITLPDGTRVWLNADSKLKFPTVFSGLDRIVFLEGEAYFEVSKNPLMPFKVRASGTEVKVLGTHFNMMAYPDERVINTTLVEGSVEILANDQRQMIKPGESAISGSKGVIDVHLADIEQTIAWKNGFFAFNNENIQDIMRKVSRWYDVEVVFAGDLKNRDFTGTISRDKNVSELLRMLQLTGAITFKISNQENERRITVMP